MGAATAMDSKYFLMELSIFCLMSSSRYMKFLLSFFHQSFGNSQSKSIPSKSKFSMVVSRDLINLKNDHFIQFFRGCYLQTDQLCSVEVPCDRLVRCQMCQIKFRQLKTETIESLIEHLPRSICRSFHHFRKPKSSSSSPYRQHNLQLRIFFLKKNYFSDNFLLIF